ncbi:MAG: HAMP domain-containing histidine kinase [Flavobacteriaceae bacterium]|nr:HAMP domain-containing histidine kinase [Flavobacteriaceae bacterium]
MSISLVGIIAVQVYWINSTIEIRESQFSSDVKYALANVSENIQKREISDYYKDFSPLIDSARMAKKGIVKNLFYSKIDTSTNEIFTFRQSILENDYKSPITNLRLNIDTLNFKSFYSESVSEISKINSISKDIKQLTPEQKFVKMGKLVSLERMQFENFFKEIAPREPIYKRVTKNELKLNLDYELGQRGINTDFGFAIYSNKFPTKVKSDNFKLNIGKTYKVPLFIDDNGNSNYYLFVNFPNKSEYILGAISKILILGAFFILVIAIAYGSAIYQLIKQKQISQIKTEFINNMTHEFKTPIATINLALDAIKNPKIISDQGKILNYVKMIREENKRMFNQVENVLRISKLEKNQLDISKEIVDISDLLEDAITHVNLIVNNRGGYINTHFSATFDEVHASPFHLKNVFVNILDNAIKYSEDAPKIDIYTDTIGNELIIKIVDQGIGMTKNVQKQVFNKFYREQTGNVHNVKGHGLGLAYVKKIVEIHHGTVSVESEKGNGSAFTIKLTLI